MALITEAQLNMANLNEEPVWEAGIYQFETTDPVEGGPEGIDNKPTRQLANRTAYLKEEQGKIKEEVLLLNQQWSENANYGIGHEVVRNGLRYIARLASGPDNGGAITPENNSGSTWDLVLPQAYSTTDMQKGWLRLALVVGDNNTAGDFLSLEVIGGSDFGANTRFSADIMIVERAGSAQVIVTPKTLGLSNPEFYIKSPSANTYELWMKKLADFSSPVTVVRKSRSRYSATVAGILSITNTAPTDITLVPYDTGYQFASIPIGMEVAFDTPPPTHDRRFRFVKLTADDAYNGSLLNNKVISGTAPNLVVKMTVNSALSPINGQQIEMLNTMGAIPTPGLTSGVIIQDAMRNLSGSVSGTLGDSLYDGATGVFDLGEYVGLSRTATANALGFNNFYFDASRQVPTADRFQPFGVSRVFYKRIY
ncbi:hypothetical protein [Vibrio cholerae]|uniref:hypothetical protein n=1 Tax=Vibrio cholerae TaxID=666 RepID=UPI0015842E4C|nr:hypothetical protein [Vibrio cholerae]QKV03892.1 hypothetical protein HPY12_08285 [Vibrio cholerae]